MLTIEVTPEQAGGWGQRGRGGHSQGEEATLGYGLEGGGCQPHGCRGVTVGVSGAPGGQHGTE